MYTIYIQNKKKKLLLSNKIIYNFHIFAQLNIANIYISC